MGQERHGPFTAHKLCDEFIQTYREKLKKFKGDKCTERHEYHDKVRPGKKKVVIIRQVAGQELCMIHGCSRMNRQGLKADVRLSYGQYAGYDYSE